MILESLIFTIAGWALLVVALWWLAGFALWTVALSGQRTGADQAVRRLADRLALPGCRRLAHGLAACVLVALPACSPTDTQPSLVYLGEIDDRSTTTVKPATTTAPPTTAHAPATQPPTTPVPPDTAPPTTLPSTTLPSTPEAQAPEAQTPSGPTPPEPSEPQAPARHRVVAGDHLWGIAEGHLSRTHPDAVPTNATIARYWRRVLTANSATLRSGDPNLIHPGEWVTLPPVD